MIFFLRNAHYNIIKHYRKKINSLLERNFELTSNEILSVSMKMDVHIYKHMKLESLIIRPKRICNSVFKLKK